MRLKKLFMLFVILNICFMIISQGLPKPKNSKLYTEFDFARYSKYLKKPVLGSGYIAMDGPEKFIFKQLSPILIEVRKNNKKMTFKKENAEAFEIDSKLSGDVMFLFDDDETIKMRFDVSSVPFNGKTKYNVIPKINEQIKSITVISIDDKVEKIEIIFNNDSSLSYTFKNTVTGITPDEKYFQ